MTQQTNRPMDARARMLADCALDLNDAYGFMSARKFGMAKVAFQIAMARAKAAYAPNLARIIYDEMEKLRHDR